jgi:hypothetical protein
MKFPYLEAKARLVRIMGTFDLATGHGDTMDELLDSLESELRDVLGHYRKAFKQQHTWVGLTDEEIDRLNFTQVEGCQCSLSYIDGIEEFAKDIEAKLREKNT